MGDKTLYSVLEVSAEASAEVIGAAHARLRALLEPKAAAGDEAALLRLQALRDAYRTLSDPALRARYNRDLAQRTATPIAFTAEAAPEASRTGLWLFVGVIAVAIAGGFWYHTSKQRAERQRAEQALREKTEALERAEAERQRIEAEMAGREAERQRRVEELRYRQWVDQSRRDGAEIVRRNQLAQQRTEHEERRLREREDRMQDLERQREEAAAKRRLEEEKRKLRELQHYNSR